MSFSDEERRVRRLTKLSPKDVRLFVRLWLGSPENQDVLKRPASLRSAILKRQATRQTVIVQEPGIAATAEEAPQLNPEPSPIRLYDGKALPRRRWQMPSVEPIYSEHSSDVDFDEVPKLIKAAKAGDNDADTALRQLAADLTTIGRPLPSSLAGFLKGPKRRRGKPGLDPATRRLQQALVFDLLCQLKNRGISPTQLGAEIVADEIGPHVPYPKTVAAVIKIWNAGARAMRPAKSLKNNK